MTTETPAYDPDTADLLHDSRGNLIDSDYIDKAILEAEVDYDLDDLSSPALESWQVGQHVM